MVQIFKYKLPFYELLKYVLLSLLLGTCIGYEKTEDGHSIDSRLFEKNI